MLRPRAPTSLEGEPALPGTLGLEPFPTGGETAEHTPRTHNQSWAWGAQGPAPRPRPLQGAVLAQWRAWGRLGPPGAGLLSGCQ